ncbi:MAG TPA: MobF family relaxase [Coleofasciculaceae cyanobacterium]|jgi:conjugative relaxase-like TrwC/TraI family protein
MVCSIGRLYAKVNDYATDNYYTQNQGLDNSQWYGQGAEILGLNGQVSTEEYNNAYQGLDNRGNPLRQRQSGKKYNPGRDITLSAPKSVTLLGLVKEDKEVIAAHKEAVKTTLTYIERNCIFTRTGKGGVNHLQTDNALFAIFQHDDNRNLDPQLHSHCVIFNQTQAADGKWRSMDNRELYQQKMTIGMVYHHELGRRIQTLGYELDWNRDGTFDVRGYSQSQLKEFSTRKQEIEKAVGVEASAATKARACTTTRKSKVHQAESERRELKQIWQQRAKQLDIRHPQVNDRHQQVTNLKDKSKLVIEATEIVSERQVAFPRHILLKESLRQSQGEYCIEDLEREINQSSSLIKTQDGRLTTEAAIDREKQILYLARNSKEKYSPLADIETAKHQAQKLGLNKAQAIALKNFVNSRDGVILCQGDAGVGKTYTVKALKETIDRDISMRGLAPSASAAGELSKGADINCQTLDAYLKISIKSLPKNELIVVDEAGMISSTQMKNLLERGEQTNSRILLIGDTKQLAAVQAGSPLKLLQEKAKLPTIRIDKNVRQQNVQLKEVVDLLSAGEIKQGYQKLNEQNSVKQIPIDSLRLKAVVNDYLTRDVKTQSQTLILAGTNKEKEVITKQVRQGLIEQDKLSRHSQQIHILTPKDLDKFTLIQANGYEIGDVVKFSHTSARFSKDLYYRVDAVDSQTKTLILRDSLGNKQDLELNTYKDRAVFQSETRELRCGEQMKFTRNHYQNQQKQINGQQFTVLGFNANGQIEIKTKGKTQTVNPDALLYSDYRYVDTVHSSQGKTANYCIYAVGSGKSLMLGRESFYVAASRAKHEFKVYTASTKALGLSIEKSRGQENALNLIMKQKLDSQLSTPSREQEFKLLVSAKYLVESQGILDPNNSHSKSYKSADGTEIKRDKDSLTVTHQDKELVFNRDNSTVRNTFTVNEIDRQIQSRNLEMQQHLNQNRTQTQSLTIGRS